MIGDDYLSRFKKGGDNKINASQIKSKFILLLNQAGESNNFRCYYWDKGMRQSNIKWNLILFYESPRTGYFITAEEVNHYLSSNSINHSIHFPNFLISY